MSIENKPVIFSDLLHMESLIEILMEKTNAILDEEEKTEELLDDIADNIKDTKLEDKVYSVNARTKVVFAKAGVIDELLFILLFSTRHIKKLMANDMREDKGLVNIPFFLWSYSI